MEPKFADYWLGHCEGFRVDSHAGRLGFVEQVVSGSRADCPDALIVRAGLLSRRLLLVPAEDVENVRPRDLCIRLRPSWRPAEKDFLTQLHARLRSLVAEAPGPEARAVAAAPVRPHWR